MGGRVIQKGEAKGKDFGKKVGGKLVKRERGGKNNLICKTQQILQLDENKPSKKHTLEC